MKAPKSEPIRYFLYARKSTDDASRQVRSIGDQIAEVREMAAREGLSIIDELTEKQSAKEPGRPVFNEMLTRIEKGHATGIIAWNPDRLSRNALDGGRIIHLLDRGLLKDLRFPTFKFDKSASGIFMLGIAFGQSKHYSDNLSENITRGMRQKVKNGYWPLYAPLGYRNDHKTRLIEPDPIAAPLIKKMFELYSTGDWGFRELRDLLVQHGLRGQRGAEPSPSKIQHALGNPIYYGVIRFNGEYYDAKHKPIITQALFDECRRVMNSRGRTVKYRFKPFNYRGMFRCGQCGCLATLEEQKGKYRYVRCSHKRGPCDQPYTREEELNHQVAQALAMIAFSDAFAAEMHQALQSRLESEKARGAEERQHLTAEIETADKRLQRLLEMSVDGAISIQEYREAKNAVIVDRQAKAQRLA